MSSRPLGVLVGASLIASLFAPSFVPSATRIARASAASEPRERGGAQGVPASERVGESGGAKPPGRETTAGPQLTDLFVAGESGYHTFRIPSLIATPAGTLLAFAEGRKGGSGDAGDIDLVLKRSRDGGTSWSPLQLVGDNGPNTFGNPCPVVDRNSGTVWLLATQNPGLDREKDIIAGTSTGSRTVWVSRSDDDGVSWSAPVEITNQVKQADWTWYATGPGVGIQTSSGRLVIPANHAEAGSGIHRSHLFFSDDGGRTWKLAASADEGTNESQIVELADGRLLLNMRNHPPKPKNFRLIATSSDGGRTLSSASPDYALIEPPAQASLMRLTTRVARASGASEPRERSGAEGGPVSERVGGSGGVKPAGQEMPRRGDDRNRLLFANPASVRRERLTLRLSYDEGATWPVSRVIHDGPAAYSSLAILPDLSIGVLLERGERSAYEMISFARITLEWLTEGKDRAPTRAGSGISLPPVPDAHGFAGAFAGVHNGQLLAAGGANFPDGVMPWNGGRKVWHDRVMALDLRASRSDWRKVGRLPAPAGYGASVSVPEGVLFIGGGNAERHIADVRLLTMRSGKLSVRVLPALPEPLALMAGAAVGRYVHVAGGVSQPDATTASANHYRLNLDASHRGWETMPSLPAAGRILAIAAGIDGAFFLFSGCSLAADATGKPVRTYLRDAWKFAANTWVRAADLPRAAAAAASPAPTRDRSIYVISGDEGEAVTPAEHGGFTKTILRYDMSQDRWHEAGSLGVPAPVTVPVVPWRDGFVLFNGELRPGVRTPQVVYFRAAS